MKQYTWNFDRITALSVAVSNMCLLIYILIRLLTDPFFLFSQIGFHIENQMLLVIFSIISLSVGLFLNVQFLHKKYYARLAISCFQTIGMASVFRNIIVGHIYFGFRFSSYIINVVAFVFYAVLIYHTLFSKHIRKYYSEKLRRS